MNTGQYRQNLGVSATERVLNHKFVRTRTKHVVNINYTYYLFCVRAAILIHETMKIHAMGSGFSYFFGSHTAGCQSVSHHRQNHKFCVYDNDDGDGANAREKMC